MYGLGLPCAKENHHDTWNTVQDLCVFVSNQETFAIKSCAQLSRAFNSMYKKCKYYMAHSAEVDQAIFWGVSDMARKKLFDGYTCIVTKNNIFTLVTNI